MRVYSLDSSKAQPFCEDRRYDLSTAKVRCRGSSSKQPYERPGSECEYVFASIQKPFLRLGHGLFSNGTAIHTITAKVTAHKAPLIQSSNLNIGLIVMLGALLDFAIFRPVFGFVANLARGQINYGCRKWMGESRPSYGEHCLQKSHGRIVEDLGGHGRLRWIRNHRCLRHFFYGHIYLVFLYRQSTASA